MSKLTYEDKINIYQERKQGNTLDSISEKYGVRKDLIKYLIRLIDKHGYDILRTNKNRNFTSYEKERIINRVLINNEAACSVDIDEGLLSNGILFNWIKEYKPNIIVITGHDYKKNNEYKNTKYFIDSIKECRRIIRNQDELIIIAGACQSDYESLICAGANFASSPKRINIHALDPAIIACSMAYSDCNKKIDIISILERTKYGCDGIGGIITKGTMYIGYPR